MHTYSESERIAANPLGGYAGVIGTDQAIAVATQANVTDVSFPIRANERWALTFIGRIVGNTNGLAFQFTGPASPNQVAMTVFANTSGITAVSTETEVAFSAATTTAFCATAVDNFVQITLYVNNGATAGTVQLQCATVSGTNSSTIKAGSFWEARRLG